MEWGLELAEPGEGPARALAAAFDMERGLEACYRGLAAQAGDAGLGALYNRLAGYEDKHMERLRAALAELDPGRRHGVELIAGGPAPRMEGGWEVSEFVAQHRRGIENPAQAVMLAMSLETQALDLYLRLARRMEQPASRRVFNELGDEEQAHLEALAKMFKNLPQG
jgi:rubrerythrin